MRGRRIAPGCLIVLLIPVLGVLAILLWPLSIRSLRVLVVDGESGVPLEGVSIRVQYGFIFNPTLRAIPPPGELLTGPDGAATFEVLADTYGWLHVTHKGYRDEMSVDLPPPHDVPDEFIQAYYGTRGVVVWVPMYSLPGPRITVVLPDDFRGTFAVELLPRPNAVSVKAGSRDIEILLPESRRVTLEATPLFYREDTLVNLGARFASGKELPATSASDSNWVKQPETIALCMGESGGFCPRPTFLGGVYFVGDLAGCLALDEELHERTSEDTTVTNIQALERYFSQPIR